MSETEDRKFYFNAQKCELSKVQILLAYFIQNKYWWKEKKYWYTVFRKSRRKFSGSVNREWNILPSATTVAAWKQHKSWTANIKNYHQRKTFREIFAKFNFSIVFSGAQVKKSEVSSNSAGAVIKLPCVFIRETKDASVSKWWQDNAFLFLLVWFFFPFRCYKVWQ